MRWRNDETVDCRTGLANKQLDFATNMSNSDEHPPTLVLGVGLAF